MKKLGLTMLGAICFFLLILLTGIATKQNNDIEDLQEQVEVLEEQLEIQHEQIEAQQDYIEEVHAYINDYTFEDGGRVFVYIDEDGNYFD